MVGTTVHKNLRHAKLRHIVIVYTLLGGGELYTEQNRTHILLDVNYTRQFLVYPIVFSKKRSVCHMNQIYM